MRPARGSYSSETEIILQREQALVIETLLQDVIVRQSEAAGEESALAWRQTVDAIRGFVAHH